MPDNVEQFGVEPVVAGLTKFLNSMATVNRAVGSYERAAAQAARSVTAAGNQITNAQQKAAASTTTTAKKIASSLAQQAKAQRGVVGDIVKLVTSTARIDSQNRRTAASVAKLAVEQTKADAAMVKAQAAMLRAETAAKRLEGGVRKLGSAKQQELAVMLKNNSAVQLAVEVFRTLEAAASTTSKAIQGLSSILGTLLNVLGAVAGVVRGLAGGALNILGKAFSILISPITGAINALGSFVNRVLAVATGVLIRDFVFFVLQGFKDISEEVFKAAQSFQTLQIRFEGLVARQIAITQGVQDFGEALNQAVPYAQELVRWVQELSLKVPIDVKDISNTLAYAQAMGFTATEAQELTLAVGNYTTGMGLSSEATERIIFNFGQMKAAGKVTATEMRDLARGAMLPLNDVLREAADILGVAGDSFQEFRKKAAEGEIDVNTFFQAFENIVAERFPNAMERFGRTLEGARVRLTNFFKTIIGGNVLGPTVARIGELLSGALDAITSPEAIKKATLIGKVLEAGFNLVVDVIRGRLLPALSQLGKAFGLTGDLGHDLAFAIAFIAIGMSRVIHGISNVISNIAGNINGGLGSIADNAYQWGVNIVGSISAGMAAAVKFIVQVIVAISKLLAEWLSPGSPPKVAPLIDKWGAAAMTEYFKGFLKADFDVFNTIADKIEGFLRSIPGGFGKDNVDLIPKILGSREVVAKAIDQLREGAITVSEAINRISKRVKNISKEFRGYLESLFEVADAQGVVARATEAVERAQDAVSAAAERTKVAQQALSKVQEKYEGILKALNEELDALTQEFEDQNRLADIQEAIGTGLLTQEERRRLETEARAIELRKQIEAVEDQRDAEVDAAQAVIDRREREEELLQKRLDVLEKEQQAAEKQLEAAEDQLAAAEALIDAQIKQNELISEQLALLEQLAKQQGGAEDTPTTDDIFGADGFGLPELPDPEDLTSQIEEIFKEARIAVDSLMADFGKALTAPWDGMFGENGTLTVQLKDFKENVRIIWEELGEIDWAAVGQGLADLPTTLGNLNTTIGDLNTTLGTIKTGFDNFNTSIANVKAVGDPIFGAIGSTWAFTLDILGTAAGVIGEKLGELTSQMGITGNEFSLFGEIVGGTIHFIYAIFVGVFQLIVGIVTGVVTSLIGIGLTFHGIWTNIFFVLGSDTIGVFEKIVLVVTQVVKAFVVSILGVIGGFVEGIIEYFKNLYDDLIGNSIIPDMLEAIKTAFTNAIDELLTSIGKFIADAIAKFTESFDQWVTAGGDLIKKLKEGAEGIYASVVTSIGTLIDDMVTKVTEGISAFFDLGASIVQGIIDGINSLKDKALAAMGALLGALKQKSEKETETDSPSKVYRRFGANLIKGMILGIEDKAKAAERVMRDTVGKIGLNAEAVNTFSIQALQERSGQSVMASQIVNSSSVDNSVHLEINPTYRNVQSEAGIFHDVTAALGAARL